MITRLPRGVPEGYAIEGHLLLFETSVGWMVTKEEKLCGGEKLLLNILMTGRRNGEMWRGIFKKK